MAEQHEQVKLMMRLMNYNNYLTDEDCDKQRGTFQCPNMLGELGEVVGRTALHSNTDTPRLPTLLSGRVPRGAGMQVETVAPPRECPVPSPARPLLHVRPQSLPRGPSTRARSHNQTLISSVSLCVE